MAREILFAGDVATGVGSRLLLSHEPVTEAGCAVLVNPWYAGKLPGFLCKTSPVVKVIQAASGIGPFKQLKRSGKLALGQCVSTGAGQMRRVNNIIHVAVATPLGRTTLETVAEAVGNTLIMARRLGARTLAMPLLGTDVGGLDPVDVAHVVLKVFARSGAELQRVILAVDDGATYERLSLAFDQRMPVAAEMDSRGGQRRQQEFEHEVGSYES